MSEYDGIESKKEGGTSQGKGVSRRGSEECKDWIRTAVDRPRVGGRRKEGKKPPNVDVPCNDKTEQGQMGGQRIEEEKEKVWTIKVGPFSLPTMRGPFGNEGV